MIEAGGPGWPMTSVMRAVTRVSPTGNAISEPTPTAGQNCTRVVATTKLGSCWLLSVQASPDVVRALNRHERSLIALADAWLPPNIGGLVAGTPPIGGSGPSSHTSVLPLPSARDTTTWRFGSALGSPRSELYVTCPTGRLPSPGRASM